MARPDKAAAVAELTKDFKGSTAVVLTEYRGLTVKNVTELRRTLGGTAKYAVVKNTLTKIAAREAGVTGLDEHLAGPSAIAFVTGDPVEAAKGLRDFARTHPALVIKGGVLDGRSMTAAEIGRLADLESREVLLAKLAGAMKGSLSQAVALFAAPLSKTARLLEARRQQLAEQDPAAAADGSPAPTESTTPAESTTPTESTAPAESTTPAESAAPTESTAPAESTTPTESATPTESTTEG